MHDIWTKQEYLVAAEGLKGTNVATDVLMWVIMKVVQGDAVSVPHAKGLWQQAPEMYLFIKDAPQLLSSSQPYDLGICLNLPHMPDNFTKVSLRVLNDEWGQFNPLIKSQEAGCAACFRYVPPVIPL